jgi:predicted P-loop ATPase
LVLEGDQGIRKSALLRKLAIRDEWFSDSLPHDLASKDARDHLAGVLIVELGEISQLKRSEVETIKSFLSCQRDRYRPSYGRLTIDWPRQNVFVATTNENGHYLRDTTGNRRFWPLKCGAIDVEGAELVIGQVWAEAAHLWWQGEQWWLKDDIELTAGQVQNGRMERDPWHDRIERMVTGAPPDLSGYRWLKTEEALEALEVPLAQRNRAHEMRVATIFMQLGGKRCRVSEGSTRPWKYRF